MVVILAELELNWQLRWLLRPRQVTGMSVEDYYNRFRVWKEEIINLSFPADEPDYIDEFIENLKWDIRFRLSKCSIGNSLTDAFYNVKFEESMMRIEGNLKEIRANMVSRDDPILGINDCNSTMADKSSIAKIIYVGSEDAATQLDVDPSKISTSNGVPTDESTDPSFTCLKSFSGNFCAIPPIEEVECSSLQAGVVHMAKANELFPHKMEAADVAYKVFDETPKSVSAGKGSNADVQNEQIAGRSHSSKTKDLEISRHMLDGMPKLFFVGPNADMYAMLNGRVDVQGDVVLPIGALSYGSEVIKVQFTATEFAAGNLAKNIIDEIERKTNNGIEEAVNIGYLKIDFDFLKQDVLGGSCSVTTLIKNDNKNHEFNVDCWHNGVLTFIFDPEGSFSSQMGCDILKIVIESGTNEELRENYMLLKQDEPKVVKMAWMHCELVMHSNEDEVFVPRTIALFLIPSLADYFSDFYCAFGRPWPANQCKFYIEFCLLILAGVHDNGNDGYEQLRGKGDAQKVSIISQFMLCFKLDVILLAFDPGGANKLLDGFMVSQFCSRLCSGLGHFDIFVWDPGQVVIFFHILEDKDVFERVGKDVVLMDTTLEITEMILRLGYLYGQSFWGALYACFVILEGLVSWARKIKNIQMLNEVAGCHLHEWMVSYGNCKHISNHFVLQVEQCDEGLAEVSLIITNGPHMRFISTFPRASTLFDILTWMYKLGQGDSIIQGVVKRVDYSSIVALENFVWDPGLVLVSSQFSTLRTRCSLGEGYVMILPYFIIFICIFVFSYLRILLGMMSSTRV